MKAIVVADVESRKMRGLWQLVTRKDWTDAHFNWLL